MVVLADADGCRVTAELFGFELFLWIGLGLLGPRSSAPWRIPCSPGCGATTCIPASHDSGTEARRLAERFGALALIAAIVLFLLMGCLPAIADHLKDSFKAAGPMAMLSGMAMAMRSFLTPRPMGRGSGPDLTANLAAALFLVGGFLVAFELAFWLSARTWVLWAALALAFVSLVFGWRRQYQLHLHPPFLPGPADGDLHAGHRPGLGGETGAAWAADVAR